ncbi:hypothetical protein MPLSOD_140061 [Mesorhizobium sp. SOD10]|nr:hypothetical protein MPLSOD_140061 [Mesorhizobium sp. SOD10]
MRFNSLTDPFDASVPLSGSDAPTGKAGLSLDCQDAGRRPRQGPRMSTASPTSITTAMTWICRARPSMSTIGRSGAAGARRHAVTG